MNTASILGVQFHAVTKQQAGELAMSKSRSRQKGYVVTPNPEIVDLCRQLRALPGLETQAKTPNGALLPALAQPLRDAGLDRLNLSLDTLQPEKFAQITRLGTLRDFHRGLQAAQAAGFTGTKLNVVLKGGINTDEIGDYVSLTQEND